MVEENTIYDLANCQSQKKTTRQICQSRHLQYNITAANRNILTIMQYVHCLRNINNQVPRFVDKKYA